MRDERWVMDMTYGVLIPHFDYGDGTYIYTSPKYIYIYIYWVSEKRDGIGCSTTLTLYPYKKFTERITSRA